MKYEYWFANVKGLSNRRKYEIRQQLETIKALYYMSESDMINMGISKKEREHLLSSVKEWKLELEYKKMEAEGIRCIPITDSAYPVSLREIHTPPYMLYVKGKMPVSCKKTVAIVGARECTPYGMCMARNFAEALAKHDIQIISGMARGIDSESQKAALQAGGTSFAILGCGVDVCYPREEKGLYEALIERGGVISEFPMRTEPLKQHFPARNRIISGMAEAVLVMEARERSGSLITADMALEQGKDVYALPGPINSILSRGCNYLIKQGADILLSPENLLEEWGILDENLCDNNMIPKKLLETSEKLVYSCLDLQPKNLSEIIAETKLTIPEILDILIRLEVKGFVKEISKNYYAKLK